MAQLSRRDFLALTTVGGLCGSSRSSAQNSSKSGSQTQSASTRPNFIVVVSDSLRADRLGCYGQKLAMTPHLDAFAAHAFCFEKAYAAACWTLPSTLSILTGELPSVHQVATPDWSTTAKELNKHQCLSPAIKTSAEYLQPIGYETAFFSANNNAKSKYGHSRGCEHYSNVKPNKPSEHVEEILDWVTHRKDERPFYAYLHMMDPHEPYTADPQCYQSIYGRSIEEDLVSLPDDPRVQNHHRFFSTNWYTGPSRIHPEEMSKQPKAVIEHFKRLYSSEVHAVDYAFGQLLAGIPDHVRENTVIIFLSDHGESFGEQGRYYHSSSIYNSQVHVPLLIQLPGMESGIRVPWTVSTCDIHPTLLTLADSGTPTATQQRALFTHTGSVNVHQDRSAITMIDYVQPDTKVWDFGVVHGDLKLISGERQKRLELYNLDTDPGEEKNIIHETTTNKDRIQNLLNKYEHTRTAKNTKNEQNKKAVWTLIEGKIDENELKALGYL